MSDRIEALLARVAKSDKPTADEIAREIAELSKRLSFGLNFERHKPERVALYGRPISVGDKVIFVPPRGEDTVESKDAWIVESISGDQSDPVAQLRHSDDPGDRAERRLEDLVFAADFRDPIHPGLKSTGRVARADGDKPFHAVINAENYHALEALLFAYQGSVDCIYIDPPYNTRDKDWKYNNDFVDGNDQYRHSKWLAFMERRLKLAKRLLNPEQSALIVTIDEKEYLRLGLLLEQVFPGHPIQMVTTVIAPSGQPRGNQMSRVEEYIFVVYFGAMKVGRDLGELSEAGDAADEGAEDELVAVSWESLTRRGTDARRVDRENQFYPIFIDPATRQIVSIGDPLLPVTTPRESVKPPSGHLEVVWPIRSNGNEGRWRISHTEARRRLEVGLVRLGRQNRTTGRWTVNYVLQSDMARIDAGEIVVAGKAADGSAILKKRRSAKGGGAGVPKTVWRKDSHNAGNYGSALLRQLLPGRRFDFPKSLYAVEDVLRLFVGGNRDALVLDFFSGSGTTAHAIMRLNKQDGGQRRAICVTNNEVSGEEEEALRRRNLRPGDPEWESLGICDHITKPRIETAVTGTTPDGDPLDGEYKFVDPFPMADGFQENVEFFTLTYENPALIELDLAFERVAPLLWLKAGSRGPRIDAPNNSYSIADAYGVLFNTDAARGFLAELDTAAVNGRRSVQLVFIVTDDEPQFQTIAAQLPGGVEAVRLYESYLRAFEINRARE